MGKQLLMSVDEALEQLLEAARFHERRADELSHNMGGTMHAWKAEALRDAYRAIQDVRGRE